MIVGGKDKARLSLKRVSICAKFLDQKVEREILGPIIQGCREL
jgi:hypothetical protein